MTAKFKLTLLDGPRAGHVVRYGNPLPKVLVVATRSPIRYHDYRQTAQVLEYRHARDCPCSSVDYPVNLDAVNS